MRIAIAADHGGFERKETIRSYLAALGHEVTDFGCFSKESVDYPDFAFQAAEAVAKNECERGIVVCTTGIGVSISANKVCGIRCALCDLPEIAALSRQHNDANMLALGARLVNDEQAKSIVSAFLETPFEAGRHQRRVDKIMKYDTDRNREE